MLDLITRHISQVSAEEISRQHALLTKGGGLRAVLTALTYALATILIPLPLVLACAIVDFGFERLGTGWMRNLDPSKDPRRYGGTLVAVAVSQMAFSTMLAATYQSQAPLAQPFAAGVMTLTMLQLASIRVIHLPYATVGLVTSFVMAIVAASIGWQTRSGPAGLVLSYIALASAAYFVYAVVRSNHALHDGIARERAAARVADQAKSRFLAQMSHELRTPLNAILGLGHVELAQATDAQSQDRLRLITDAARGLTVILDDILDMAAIEAGRLPVRPSPCDLRAELTASAALYHPLFLSQGLTCALSFAPDLPQRATLDQQRLRQCLSNLFSNALKHTATGGITLHACLTDQGQLAIAVKDTGPGIPKSETARIFEPFHRGSSATPGSGLGLSICRDLARAMGGDLQFLPSAEGAHFLLTLSIGDVLPAPDTDADAAALPADLGRFRVLVVDDIATNRLVAIAHLRLLGIKTDQAASGAEALDILRRDPPDLVLLDMNMPEMDGAATLKHIRALPSRASRLPVIAMTADSTDAHRRAYLAKGLDGYLSKPLTPEALHAVLARHLDPNA